MERNKKIMVIINHREVLIDAINKFNEIHGTDFEFIEFVNDEVNYAYIGYDNVTDNQLFNFGFQFGKLIMHLRNKGELTD